MLALHACVSVAFAAAPAPDAGVPLASYAPQVDGAVLPFLEAKWMNQVAVALVRGNDVWFRGYGGADEKSLFEIGSITKVFTGVALADAVVDHRASLSDPVAKFLPPDIKVAAYADRAITLEDLATQSSGLPRLPDNLHPAEAGDPYADYGAASLRSFLNAYALPRAPGAQYEYSNLGFGVLGFALAHQAATSYEKLLAARVTGPLQLESTVMTLPAASKPRLTQGHHPNGSVAHHWHFDALAGCGALLSDAADLARFLQLNLGVRPTSLSAALALARAPRRTTPLGHIGLGWNLRDADGIVWHNGGTGGYRTFIGFDPARGTGAVVLSNQVANEVDGLGFWLVHLLEGDAFAPPQAVKTVTLAAAALDKYVGTYERRPMGWPLVYFKVARAGDGLTVQLTGQEPIHIFASSETEFFVRDVGARITFTLDEHGAPQKLVLHQNGTDQTAVRVK